MYRMVMASGIRDTENYINGYLRWRRRERIFGLSRRSQLYKKWTFDNDELQSTVWPKIYHIACYGPQICKKDLR
ncbi:unnamed protein product [Enterobius vermicularis]|uniref:Uncharacterized protein n=1 Tax=Enterobius vermicularis TaxID=51028 RepID=A0A0N4VJJ6_ENTVE|nr:unnamed protein product [Enterobius vermicularis]